MWCVMCDAWCVMFWTWFFVRSWLYELRGDQKHPIWVIYDLFNDIPKSIPGGCHMYTISCKASYPNQKETVLSSITTSNRDGIFVNMDLKQSLFCPQYTPQTVTVLSSISTSNDDCTILNMHHQAVTVLSSVYSIKRWPYCPQYTPSSSDHIILITHHQAVTILFLICTIKRWHYCPQYAQSSSDRIVLNALNPAATLFSSIRTFKQWPYGHQ